MDKTIFHTPQELERSLKVDVLNSSKPIAIIGGHYAIDKHGQPGISPDSEASFGIFPLYTFDLGCRLVKLARDKSKTASLVLLVDDHTQMPDKQWYMKKDNPQAEKIRKIVDNYFQNFSVPSEYRDIMDRYSLTKNSFLHSERGLPFQESWYREKFVQKTGMDTGCAGEYRLILEEIARKEIGLLISLAPACCQAPICTALNFYNLTTSANPNLKTVHIFLSSNKNNSTAEEMFEEMNSAGEHCVGVTG